MDGINEVMGKSVRLLRRQNEKTQEWVAHEMAARGYKWTQYTVWAVESGKRPLKVDEAFDLTSILDAPMMALFDDPRAQFAQAFDALQAEGNAFMASVLRMQEAQQRLKAIAREHGFTMSDLSTGPRGDFFASTPIAHIVSRALSDAGDIVDRPTANSDDSNEGRAQKVRPMSDRSK